MPLIPVYLSSITATIIVFIWISRTSEIGVIVIGTEVSSYYYYYLLDRVQTRRRQSVSFRTYKDKRRGGNRRTGMHRPAFLVVTVDDTESSRRSFDIVVCYTFSGHCQEDDLALLVRYSVTR